MIRGFYTAASGLVSQQNNLNTVANNMANVSTTGCC
jgi:flagellar basal-body rod protein FlgG